MPRDSRRRHPAVRRSCPSLRPERPRIGGDPLGLRRDGPRMGRGDPREGRFDGGIRCFDLQGTCSGPRLGRSGPLLGGTILGWGRSRPSGDAPVPGEGTARPRVGGAIPNGGPCFPMRGRACPRVGGTVPGEGAAGPSVGGSGPGEGRSRPQVGRLPAPEHPGAEDAPNVPLRRRSGGFHEQRQAQRRARQVGGDVAADDRAGVEAPQAPHDLPVLFQAVAPGGRLVPQAVQAAPAGGRPDRLEQQRRLPAMEDRQRRVPPRGALPGMVQRHHPLLLDQRKGARSVGFVGCRGVVELVNRFEVGLAEGVERLGLVVAHGYSPVLYSQDRITVCRDRRYLALSGNREFPQCSADLFIER